MSIRLYKSYTPGTRNRALSTFSEITKSTPEKSLIRKNHRNKGRNNRGVITIRHRGGGHKRKYRLIDFQRNKHNIEGTIASIEYDPNRNARIALVHYEDGEKRYILHPNNIKVGDKVKQGQHIGYSGNTGRSSGPHLHFVVRKERDIAIPVTFIGYEGKELKKGRRYHHRRDVTRDIHPKKKEI